MERETLTRAVGRIALGYLLLHVNFSLGTLNILPNWLGYWMILQVLPILGEEEPSALLLRPLGILLACWEGIMWGLAALGMSFDGWGLGVAATALGLYFHFQLLTNLADLAGRQRSLTRRRILTLRTARTLLATLFALPLPWARYEGLTITVVVVNLLVALLLCAALFALRDDLGTLSPE